MSDTGVVGFGPFDEDIPMGLSEYGGGAGLVEGSPFSESAALTDSGRRIENKDEVLGVDEKIGVQYRTPAEADVGSVEEIDDQTGLTPSDVL